MAEIGSIELDPVRNTRYSDWVIKESACAKIKRRKYHRSPKFVIKNFSFGFVLYYAPLLGNKAH